MVKTINDCRKTIIRKKVNQYIKHAKFDVAPPFVVQKEDRARLPRDLRFAPN